MAQLLLGDRECYVPKSASFGYYTSKEILARSVTEINSVSLDPNTEGGINDRRLGSADWRLPCGTCFQYGRACHGHFGHIKLPVPLYNPLTIRTVFKFLRSRCFLCQQARVILPVRKLLSLRPEERFAFACSLAEDAKTCAHCNAPQPMYKLLLKDQSITTKLSDDVSEKTESKRELAMYQTAFTSRTAYEILNATDEKTATLFGFKDHPREAMTTILLVPSCIIRPPVIHGEGGKARGQDEMTIKLVNILKAVIAYQEATSDAKKRATAAATLQYEYSTSIDNEVVGQKKSLRRTQKARQGISNQWGGKTGRYRLNLMGRRTSTNARTVITSDSEIAVDEIGIPAWYMKALTQPVRVTTQNWPQVREFLDAPICPIRMWYSRESEFLKGVLVSSLPLEKRRQLNIPVGDMYDLSISHLLAWILMNRQPSLHRASIMAHRARLLPWNTFRLNLACTTPYNADFDGDEMNLHVPQSWLSRAEAWELLKVANHIISPKDAAPIIALKHSMIAMVYLLTETDRFFEDHQVMEFLVCTWGLADTFPETYQLPIPAILKPRPLWTGKQIASFFIPLGLNLVKTFKTPREPVVVRDGELLTGRLCKQSLGCVAGNLIQVAFQDLKPKAACDLLTAAQRLLNQFMIGEGFSEGLADALPSREHRSKIEALHAGTFARVHQLYKKVENVGGRPHDVEGKVSMALNGILEKASDAMMDEWRSGIKKRRNPMLTMIESGSKGAAACVAQVTSCVGQQSLSGKRLNTDAGKMVRRMFPSESFDSWHPCDRGFVTESYVTGLSPVSFFMHAMTGREGVIDTAMKTAEIGYLQHRMMKAVESHIVEEDGTVRNSSGHIIEFQYGGDGVEATALNRVNLSLLTETPESIAILTNQKQYPDEYQLIMKLRETLIENRLTIYTPILQTDATLPFTPERVIENVVTGFYRNRTESRAPAKTRAQLDDVLRKHGQVAARFAVWSCLCSEQVKQRGLTAIQETEIYGRLLDLWYRSRVAAKEMVGPLAASSIGEPATQMTLNTFHLAGVASKHVNTGIPRLIEVFDATESIRSPSTTVFFLPSTPIPATEFPQLLLSDVLDEVPKITAKKPKAIAQFWLDVTSDDDKKNLPYCVLSLNKSKLDARGMTIATIADLVAECAIFIKNSVMYDSSGGSQICIQIADPEMTLVKLEKYCRNQLIAGVRGCTHATARTVVSDAYSRETKKKVSTTEEVVDVFGFTDLVDLWFIPGVDCYRTISNQVHEMFELWGLEGAFQLQLHELRQVMQESSVQDRHMLHMCNTMLATGRIVPYNRYGINRNPANGPILRASFEETREMLANAARHGTEDPLRDVSATVSVGRMSRVGTGAVSVYTDPSYLANYKALMVRRLQETQNAFGTVPTSAIVRTRLSVSTADSILHVGKSQPVTVETTESLFPTDYSLARIEEDNQLDNEMCIDNATETYTPRSPLYHPPPDNAIDTYTPRSPQYHQPPDNAIDTYTPRSPLYHQPLDTDLSDEIMYTPKSPTYQPFNETPKSPTHHHSHIPSAISSVWNSDEITETYTPSSPGR